MYAQHNTIEAEYDYEIELNQVLWSATYCIEIMWTNLDQNS